MGKLTLLKDYAEKCGLPVRTLRRLCQDRTLPALQIGRAYYVDTDAADAELAASVRTEIDAAGSSVSTAKSRIDNAAAAADRVEARIRDAQERAEYVKETADEGRRIIAEC